MPEAGCLELDASYRKQLLELFKGILALTRETHIKQLEAPLAGAARQPIMIRIFPELSVEPLATYYFRRAASYSFIRKILEATFGAPALENMHRLTATGPVPSTLAEELFRSGWHRFPLHTTAACRMKGFSQPAFPSILGMIVWCQCWRFIKFHFYGGKLWQRQSMDPADPAD